MFDYRYSGFIKSIEFRLQIGGGLVFDQFPEFYRDESFDDRDAVIAFDSSAVLDLFRLNRRAASNILKHLNKVPRANRFIPHQVAVEYHRNLESVLQQSIAEIVEYKNAFLMLVQAAANERRYPHLSPKCGEDLKRVHDNICAELDKQTTSIRDTICQRDGFKESVAKVFSGCIGPAPDASALELLTAEATERYARHVPPGYKDSGKKNGNASGDFIVWRQLIDKAKTEDKNVVLVTQDQKEDWLWIVGGMKIGPRPELRKEFREETGRDFTCVLLPRFIEKRLDDAGKKAQGTPDMSELRAAVDSLKALRNAEPVQQNPMMMMLKLMQGMQGDESNYTRKLGKIMSLPDEVLEQDEDAENGDVSDGGGGAA